jgi:general secretion pathway protein B
MSLILDALKKSEAERQRQTGPTLLEVRISQPRRRYPVWMLALGALLAVNILLLLYFVVRRPAAAPSPQAAAVYGAAATPGAAPAAAATVTPATLPAITPAATPVVTAATAATVPTAAAASAPGPLPAGVAPMTGALAPGGDADGVATPYALGDAPVLGRNPADDEPAVSAVSAGDSNRYASLPSFADVGGDLPALRLDLHVFAERPRDRYALINMHRVREGDVLPEGARVLAITRDGVALAWRNQEFMLRPQ